MRIIVSLAEIEIAITEYLNQKGMRASSPVTIVKPWGENIYAATNVEPLSPTAPALRPRSVAMNTGENAARAAYDLVCRVYSTSAPLLAWSDLSLEVKKKWLAEADEIVARGCGQDSGS